MSQNYKITRNNLFYSESDYLFDSTIGEDYVKEDLNQTILLIKIDRSKTNVNIWGDTTESGVVYNTPIELNVIYSIDKAKNMSYEKNKNVGNYKLIGNLKVSVYIKTLVESNVDILYGDYIGIRVTSEEMQYFEVTNDGKMDFDNSHTLFGYKPLYRTILATSLDKNIFDGK